MNCLINETIDRYMRKGRRMDVIARYIRLKYKVTIENSALSKRLDLINLNY
ncbi:MULTISPECIES: hypothetical protein [Roseivirga]|uniref:hypothetical protein n=1 Tax=Roseivirga TaxID=290180 RepID=UPI0016757902|nr:MULTISPECIES: hypothetical protein [Roseivirga]MEC7752864.1 hypothetical protein [Bacteroidota bacterium]